MLGRKTRTRTQRIVGIVGFAVVACMLHVILCDWVVRSPHSGHPLLAFRDTAVTPPLCTGLVSDDQVSLTMAALLGVAVPVIMVVLSIYQFLDWRRESSTARGRCPSCGYDLRAATADFVKCPECGWPEGSDA